MQPFFERICDDVICKQLERGWMLVVVTCHPLLWSKTSSFKATTIILVLCFKHLGPDLFQLWLWQTIKTDYWYLLMVVIQHTDLLSFALLSSFSILPLFTTENRMPETCCEEDTQVLNNIWQLCKNRFFFQRNPCGTPDRALIRTNWFPYYC